ncbi:MAG: SDR family oxidoreductase [Cyanobacteriota bacterium]
MKTVLITGTSSGIGKATAKFFYEKGWNVAATMRNPEKEQDLIDDKSLKKIKLDVQDKNTIKSAIKETIDTFGKIDLLINNAGYGSAGPLESATDEQIKRQFDVNLFGLIDVIREVLPHFRANKNGLIINISSIGGLVTFPFFSLYHSTKWALEGLTESLQYELNPLGIKLKIVEPGGVKTDFAGRSLDMFDSSNYPDYQENLGKIVKYFSTNVEREGNLSTSEKIAGIIYDAATDGSEQFRYVAGDDAQQIWQLRQQVKYEDFRAGIKNQMLS